MTRCEIYERTYEGCSEAEGPFIKLWDLGSRCAAYNVYGRMSATILPYLLALHLRSGLGLGLGLGLGIGLGLGLGVRVRVRG